MVDKEKQMIPDNGTLVPLTSAHDLDHTIRFAKKWEQAGNTHIEILLRSENSIQAVELISKETSLVVAAGTVLSTEQLGEACEAGADLIITPGLSKKLVVDAQARGKTLIPGVQTPTEIMSAIELGLSTLKFFPASLHSPKHIGDYATIFPSIRFIPTGGINAENYESYLNLPNVIAVGGRWMIEESEG